jgi:hypothetical protein
LTGEREGTTEVYASRGFERFRRVVSLVFGKGMEPAGKEVRVRFRSRDQERKIAVEAKAKRSDPFFYPERRV